jgi:8-oxo-dGTP pyrophosphatase MutT (NUDIX family)
VDATASPDDVVAGIAIRGGRVLLCHRCPGRSWYPDVWDLPGGHRETDETPTRALVRELEEELGIVIEEPSGPEFGRLLTAEFDMRIWIVTRWVGSPTNAAPGEHDDVRPGTWRACAWGVEKVPFRVRLLLPTRPCGGGAAGSGRPTTRQV